jgi:hypothetical protein
MILFIKIDDCCESDLAILDSETCKYKAVRFKVFMEGSIKMTDFSVLLRCVVL